MRKITALRLGRSRSLLLGTALLALLTAASARAATDTYTGVAGADVGVSTNWNGGTGPAPGAGDIALWTTASGTSGGNLTTGISWGGLQVISPTGAITINATTAQILTLGANGINMSAATQNLTLGTNVQLAAGTTAQQWNIASGRTITLSGGVTGGTPGTVGITLNGAGTVNVSNTLAYSGSILVNSGTLTVGGNPTSFTGSGTNILLNNGATFTTGNQLAATGTITAVTGTVFYTSSNATQSALIGGNGNINMTSAAAVNGPLNTMMNNYGGVLSLGTNADGYRLGAGTTGTQTQNWQFATIDLGSSTSNMFSKNSNILILGGLQASGGGTAMVGPNSTGGTSSLFILGDANTNTTFAGKFLIGTSTSPASPTLIKVGTGTMTLTDSTAGAFTSTGANGFNGGTLKVDYSTNPTGVFNSASTATFGGGTLSLLGKSSGATTQTLGAVTLAQGGGSLLVNPNGGTSTTLTLGAITTTAVGSSLNIQTPGTSIGIGTAVVTTTTAPNAPGTYGANITYGSDWATSTSVATPFTLSSFNSNITLPTSVGDATNDLVSGSQVQTGNATTNSLKITTTGAGQSLDIGGFNITLTNGGLLFSGANDYTLGVTPGDALKSTTSNLIIQQLGTGVLTVAANVGAAGKTLTKAGPGTVVLTNTSNTYTGATFINGGTLSVSSNANLGQPAGGAAINLSGGTLQATSTFGLNNGGAGTNDRAVTISGAGGTFDVTSGNTLTVSGVVSPLIAQQSGPLVKTNSGTLVLSGTNTYTGATIISGGTLSVGTLANGGTASGIGASANAAPGLILDGGSLQYTGGTVSTDRSFTVTANGGGLDSSGSGALSLLSNLPVVFSGTGNRALTLSGTNTNANVMAGSIGDPSSGSTSVVKSGAGSWQVGNATTILGNTYTGSTTVTGGTLKFTGNINSTSAISVAATSVLDLSATGLTRSGASQTLTGAGSVLGNVSVGTNSVITPGDGGVFGTLTVGNLSMSAGSVANFQLGSGNSSILSTGALTLSGGASTILVDLFNGGTSTLGQGNSGQTYTIFTYGTTLTGTSSILTWANRTNGLHAVFGVSGSSITVTISGTVAPVSTWNINSGGSWNTAGNWDAGGIPNSAEATATFGSAITSNAVVTLDGNETVGTVTFNNAGSNYTVAAGTPATNALIFDSNGSGASIVDTAGNHTISAAVSLKDTLTVSVANAGDKLTISGVVSNNTTAKTLTKSGPGTLVLGTANTYGPATAGTTGTILTGGTIQVQDAGALGAGDLAVNNNASLQAGTAGLAVKNNVIIGSGVTATVDTQANNLTLSGTISEAGASGSLAKTGTGTLTLNGTNSYTGSTTVSNGALQIGDGTTGSLNPTGTITVGATGTLIENQGTGGTLGNNIVNNGAINTVAAGANTLSGSISGTGSFTQSGAGVTTVSGTNSFSGNTVISGGQLVVGSAAALGGSTLYYNGQGGTLSFGTQTATSFGGLAGSQDLALDNATPAAVALTVGSNNQNTAYSGNLSGDGSLTKAGTGTMTLTNASSFTGAVTVNAGILALPAGGNLSNVGAVSVPTTAAASAQLLISGGTLVSSALSTMGNSGGTELLITSGTATFNGGLTTAIGSASNGFMTMTGGTLNASNITLSRTGLSFTSQPTSGSNVLGFYNNGGAVNVTGFLDIGALTAGTNSSSNYRQDSGSTTVGGPVTIGLNNGGRWSDLDVNGGTFTSTDTVTGIGIVGNGNTSESGNAVLLVRAGTVNANKITLGVNTGAGGGNDTAVGSNVLSLTGGNLYVGTGGIVAGNFTGYTNSVSLAGGTLGALGDWSTNMSITLGAATEIKAADSSNVAHNITMLGGLSGSGPVTKTGNGSLTFQTVDASFGGGLNINGGTVVLTSTGNLSGSSVTVNSGGTLKSLGGNVTTPAGLVSVLSGGKLATAGTGSSVFSLPNLTLSPGSTMAMTITNTNGVSDLITVPGTLTFTASGTYNFDFTGSTYLNGPTFTYTLISYGAEGVDPGGLVFSASGLPAGANPIFTLGGGILTLTVPEPSTYALALGGAALLLGLRRRQKARQLLTQNTHQASHPHDRTYSNPSQGSPEI